MHPCCSGLLAPGGHDYDSLGIRENTNGTDREPTETVSRRRLRLINRGLLPLDGIGLLTTRCPVPREPGTDGTGNSCPTAIDERSGTKVTRSALGQYDNEASAVAPVTFLAMERLRRKLVRPFARSDTVRPTSDTDLGVPLESLPPQTLARLCQQTLPDDTARLSGARQAVERAGVRNRVPPDGQPGRC